MGFLAGIAPAQAQWLSREAAIMGTAIRVELWAKDKPAGEAAIDAVMDEMRRIDREMSPYKPESELSRINREAADHAVPISAEMFDILSRSIEFSKLSQVMACEVVSSELRATDLERKLVSRVRLFDFGAKNVGVMAVTYPIDFLPS